jgi:uncharacterized protein (DUF433 family)
MAIQERSQPPLERWIEPNPFAPGLQEAQLVEYGIPVWALIAHLRVAGDPQRVAEDYEVPLEAVEAALAYYALHRYLIDARIALNDAALSA